jgi:hypothetical protein
VSERVPRFPGRTWDELEGLPQPLRNAAHRAIFHLPDEPVPALAEPFPEQDPLPGAYRLHLPSDGLTIGTRSRQPGKTGRHRRAEVPRVQERAWITKANTPRCVLTPLPG